MSYQIKLSHDRREMRGRSSTGHKYRKSQLLLVCGRCTIITYLCNKSDLSVSSNFLPCLWNTQGNRKVNFYTEKCDMQQTPSMHSYNTSWYLFRTSRSRSRLSSIWMIRLLWSLTITVATLASVNMNLIVLYNGWIFSTCALVKTYALLEVV